MAKLLDNSASESSDSESGNAGVVLDFKVNEDYAKRFEHNKKREELLKLEEKLGKSSRKRKRDAHNESESDSDSSSSEDEDDEGELATAALDHEIFATLTAIKSKDPRVYDEKTTFYTEVEDGAHPAKEKKDKPVYLRDYHRQNLLNGFKPDDQEEKPLTYDQEQEQLKKSIVSEMHAAADSSDEENSDEEGGLLVRSKKEQTALPKVPAGALDVENADRDPETFLSNFMAARAWVPTDRGELHPFESDDDEEDERAEKFEEAYNMRFEAPEKSNETLRSYARDMAERYSVRRDENNPRKKKREAERAAKNAAKQQSKDDKARLKKLRMEEIEEKVKRIKRAAGLKTSDLEPKDWSRFIDDDWDDDQWEAEMQRRFGDQYYAEQDHLSEGSIDEQGATKKRRKPKKPKFDDDIDIKDIIPDFEDDDDDAAADFSLSEEDATQSRKKSKSKKQERIEKQKDARKDRRMIEQLVDDQLQLDLQHALPVTSRNKSSGFRYRDTSPQAFGLTSRDILLADDSALNQFAGLKKLASWREEEKKRKDKKHLGKKARLRKWRMETFGDENGPTLQDPPTDSVMNDAAVSDEEVGGVDIREGGKKKKGRRRKKTRTDSVTVET